jgi:nitrate/nitrite transport system substrate-binding protein
MRFGIPFEYSMQNLVLRYYLAEHGLDPDKDVELRVFPPPDSVANLRSGNLDGMIYAEPWCQRAIYEGVGFYHFMSKDIVPGHPCCAFGVKESFIAEAPNTYAALYRAISKACAFAHKTENRKEISEKLSAPAYLNQPQVLVEQVLVGTYADGKGGIKKDPERIDYQPTANPTMSMWMVTQLRRWGYLKSDIDYRAFIERVLRLSESDERLKQAGMAGAVRSNKNR